ncbi:hypothetical protein H9Y04_32535 [Streptomyces sp. TRM66268-LWL]|uniref:Uncharacterized protein n=1 Tax=Streptomyces polyasparticus TaxID=2767826 RepID=A0ABR7SRH1_9ACTN|nr:hypothetical protein [Streptomyces polyasparticus]MBC9717265.1 hypothetical protein [Streptomyces polyasparticus]
MPLPPPPPPAPIRTWPDRASMLADRERALEELRKRTLHPGRLMLLWLTGLLALFGWAMVCMPLLMAANDDVMAFIVGPFCAVLGLGALVPAVIIVWRGARTDRRVRELTESWLELDGDPTVARRLRAPGRSLAWLLLSFLPCAGGLWAAFGGTYAATNPYEAVLALGSGTLLWLTGLLGAARAYGHYQWVMRDLGNPRASASVL